MPRRAYERRNPHGASAPGLVSPSAGDCMERNQPLAPPYARGATTTHAPPAAGHPITDTATDHFYKPTPRRCWRRRAVCCGFLIGVVGLVVLVDGGLGATVCATGTCPGGVEANPAVRLVSCAEIGHIESLGVGADSNPGVFAPTRLCLVCFATDDFAGDALGTEHTSHESGVMRTDAGFSVKGFVEVVILEECRVGGYFTVVFDGLGDILKNCGNFLRVGFAVFSQLGSFGDGLGAFSKSTSALDRSVKASGSLIVASKATWKLG